MDKRSLAWGAGLMALAVAMGAFGAHGLKAYLDGEALSQWKVGVEYHFIHALGLLALAAFHPQLSALSVARVRFLLIMGIALFSGSLYLLSTRSITGLHGLGPVLGPLTPVGGLMFIAGWTLLLITALRHTDQD